jgi:hypothetical protein
MLLSRSANDGPAGLSDELIPKHDPDRGLCRSFHRSLHSTSPRLVPLSVVLRRPFAFHEDFMQSSLMFGPDGAVASEPRQHLFAAHERRR